MDSSNPNPSIFREEAVDHYLRETEGVGLLRVSPPWTWVVLWVGGAIVLAALILSFTAQVEVNDRGRGILRPIAGLRQLAAPATGVVAELNHHPGELIHAGEPILRLDSPQLRGNLLEADRQLSLLHSDFSGVALVQDRLFERQAEDIRRKIASAEEDLGSARHSVEIRRRQLKANKDLHGAGIVGVMEVENAEELLEQALKQERSASLSLRLAVQEQEALTAQHRQQVYTRKSELSQATGHRETLDLSLSQNLVTAPVDGYLDGLVVRPGDLVQPGQPLAKLIPTTSALHVVSFLPEKNRGFVRPGDEVLLELNQFPYAEFGTLRGKVLRVAQDLASSAEWKEAMGDEAREEGASIRLEIEVKPASNGPLSAITLRPGMLMQVRYTLRRQTLITFVLAPLKRWFH